MNERIKELEKQSYITFKDENSFECLVFSKEKFAELIVRECISEMQSSQRGDPYTGDLYDCEYNTCINEQITMLKECFGVEE